MSFRLPGLTFLPASEDTKSSQIISTDADATMRIAMESSGVRFDGNVAYVRSSGGSLRNLDLAPGDGCWHTVQQYEAQLMYDNHSSIVSISLNDLHEDGDDIGVRENENKCFSTTVENQRMYFDPTNGDIDETDCSSYIFGLDDIAEGLNSSISRQEVADESEQLSMQASRRVSNSRSLSKERASDLAK